MNRFAGVLGESLGQDWLRSLNATAFAHHQGGLRRGWQNHRAAFFGQTESGDAGDPHSGAALVGDIRLDERERLMSKLRMEGAGDGPKDADLVLAAFLKWGSACVDHLVGDFAFAVYDPSSQGLFLARDPFGIKPFFYRHAHGKFWFASDTRDLVVGGRTVEETQILQFLAGESPAGQGTFYREILRLRAGDFAFVNTQGLKASTYYVLKPAEVRGGEASEQFRELFTRSVENRMRGAPGLGAMLSGGLDSSSIAAVAAQLSRKQGLPPLATFSRVFDETPAWNERPYIEAVVEADCYKAVYLASDRLDPFAELDAVLEEQDGPFLAPGLPLSRSVYRAAAAMGAVVLLDGHGGDEVVSHGWGRLSELARQGRFVKLWQEAKGVSAAYNDAPSQLAAGALMHNRFARIALKTIRRARRTFVAPRAPQPPRWSRYINPEAMRRTGFAAPRSTTGAGRAVYELDEVSMHRTMLMDELQPYAMEVLHRNSSALGIEARYPFWDRPLVEFCLGLEAREKLDGGWSRKILREAMEGILPPKVQWRRDKLDFSPHLVMGLLHHSQPLIDEVLNDDSRRVAEFINVSEVKHAYSRIQAEKELVNGLDVQAVWRTVVLDRWLQRTDLTIGQIEFGRTNT